MSFIKPLNYLNHYHREYKDKIFSEKVDFNEAYRLGYDRVGCWCCPNNNQRAQFLSKIYMPEKYKEWRNFLISFAKK